MCIYIAVTIKQQPIRLNGWTNRTGPAGRFAPLTGGHDVALPGREDTLARVDGSGGEGLGRAGGEGLLLLAFPELFSAVPHSPLQFRVFAARTTCLRTHLRTHLPTYLPCDYIFSLSHSLKYLAVFSYQPNQTSRHTARCTPAAPVRPRFFFFLFLLHILMYSLLSNAAAAVVVVSA